MDLNLIQSFFQSWNLECYSRVGKYDSLFNLECETKFERNEIEFILLERPSSNAFLITQWTISA